MPLQLCSGGVCQTPERQNVTVSHVDSLALPSWLTLAACPGLLVHLHVHSTLNDIDLNVVLMVIGPKGNAVVCFEPLTSATSTATDFLKKSVNGRCSNVPLF